MEHCHGEETITTSVMEAAGKDSRMAEQRQVKKSKNTGGSPEKCPKCKEGYDGTMQRPHTLWCGHTVCTLCIDKLKVHGRVACPECCVSTAMPEGGQLSVSHNFEALIKMMKDAEVAAAAAALPPPSAGKGKGAAGTAGKKKGARLFKKMKSILEKQEATVEAAITACREAQSQLDQYRTTLTGWVERQQQVEDRLLGLVDQSRSARKLLQQEESRAAAKAEEMKKGEQGLQDMLEMLSTPTTPQEVEEAVAKVLHCTGETEKVVENFRECFPNDSTIREVRETSSAALEAVQAVQALLKTLPYITTEEPRPQSDPDSTIMDRLHLIWTESLTAEDLRSLTKLARRLLEGGRMFAVHQAEGQRRHARISLEADQLYLHALKDHPPPEGAATLQVSEVVPPSPPCTVFLDLSWLGSVPRRVKIHLGRDTQWGRQFLLLCTGQRGPSYVNTRLFQVTRKGDTGENVKGGHFMSNDGHWTSAMLPGLGKGSVWYRRPNNAGDVFGLEPTGRSQCGLFGIFTSDRDSSVDSPHSLFGEVVEGLDVVSEAAKHTDIEEVTVVDCGVELKVLANTTTRGVELESESEKSESESVE